MQITYDVILPERRTSCLPRSEESIAIEAFLHGTQKNMCFSYNDNESAKRKYKSIQSMKRSKVNGPLFDVFRVDERIYIVRNSPQRVKELREARKGANKNG